MKAAIEAMRNEQMSSYKAFSFQLTTNNTTALCWRPTVKLKWSSKKELGRKQVLPCEVENDLAEHCLVMQRKFLGLTMADAVHLAY